jgi:hypothetical protein
VVWRPFLGGYVERLVDMGDEMSSRLVFGSFRFGIVSPTSDGRTFHPGVIF